MGQRDVARAARRSIDIAHERLHAGDALLVFAEGARSRTAAMQQLLAGAARYVDIASVMILPVGITGTEVLFPVGQEKLSPVRIEVRVGRAISADALRKRAGGSRRIMMDAIGLLIAALLPAAYRGVYADAAPGLDDARRVVQQP
jgi:1-acyl-sn-glycerol-3-phosphate acyltransferase